MDALRVYEELTDGLRRPVRVLQLVAEAAERFPGILPGRDELAAERERPQKDKLGLELAQGEFVARVLADTRCGAHLVHAMSQPTTAALEAAEQFAATGSADLGPMRVDRDGNVGTVTIQNHAYLNAEDDASTAAMEVAIDLVLLDERIEIGVLRGAPATHPKHAGRRIFGAGINLTHLYDGRISLLGCLIERELGGVHKMYRGHPRGLVEDGDLEERREVPWVAAVESFAIGGACQLLLVMDRVIAERGSYFTLPAHTDGIIPGCANLRLPRLVGERTARQALFFGRAFMADDADGRLIADEVVEGAEMDAAIARAVATLSGSGTVSMVANRRQLRIAQEPVDRYRRYMAGYALGQARCLHAPALIANLERNWEGRRLLKEHG